MRRWGFADRIGRVLTFVTFVEPGLLFFSCPVHLVDNERAFIDLHVTELHMSSLAKCTVDHHQDNMSLRIAPVFHMSLKLGSSRLL